MENYELMIGNHIREVRLQRGLSQEALAANCGFSNTTLSAYENGRKIPSLVTTAKIAQQLNVSIDRLYYGDENNSFIISAPDEGKKIVNSIYFLWKTGVITYYENFFNGMEPFDYEQSKGPKGVYLYLRKFSSQIKRLISSLNEFEAKKDTYPDQKKYLEILFYSVAAEINNQIEHDRTEFEQREKLRKAVSET